MHPRQNYSSDADEELNPVDEAVTSSSVTVTSVVASPSVSAVSIPVALALKVPKALAVRCPPTRLVASEFESSVKSVLFIVYLHEINGRRLTGMMFSFQMFSSLSNIEFFVCQIGILFLESNFA